MSSPTPPRPNGVGRPGSGKHHEPAPKRSISPAPSALRPEELASKIPGYPTQVIEAQRDPQAADPRREPIQLPSPRADRRHVRTETAWPPSDGYLPGMPESMPPARGKLESHQHLHVILEREARERDDSMAPRSARQRAGDALKGARQPLLVSLISTVLSGGGVTAWMASREPSQPDSTAGAAYALTKAELERIAAEQRRQAEQQAQFQGWVLGYLRATGARIDAPPGAPAPTQVEIRATPAPTASVAPIMASRKRGGAPQPARVEVLTPPPAALPPPKPPDLPERIGP